MLSTSRTPHALMRALAVRRATARARPSYWDRSAPICAIGWFATRPEADARRIAAVFVLFIASMVFWAIFEQAGTTLTLFADELTRTELLGLPFPSSWFQSVNALFVIALVVGPAIAWQRFSGRGHQ